MCHHFTEAIVTHSTFWQKTNSAKYPHRYECGQSNDMHAQQQGNLFERHNIQVAVEQKELTVNKNKSKNHIIKHQTKCFRIRFGSVLFSSIIIVGC